MVDYREILRLKSLGYKNTDIASSVHSSRNTIQEVVNLAGALKISWPLEDNVSNAALEELLYPGGHETHQGKRCHRHRLRADPARLRHFLLQSCHERYREVQAECRHNHCELL